MSSELKPCPFCGGEAREGVHGVYCQRCYAQSASTRLGHDVNVANWNRRAASPAVKALVETANQYLSICDNPTLDAFTEALEAVEREIGGA